MAINLRRRESLRIFISIVNTLIKAHEIIKCPESFTNWSLHLFFPQIRNQKQEIQLILDCFPLDENAEEQSVQFISGLPVELRTDGHNTMA